MAQLKDSTVNGNLNITGDLYIGSSELNVEDQIDILNNKLTYVISSEESKTHDTFFGKPVYTKTFRFTTTIVAGTTMKVDLNIPNVDYLWIDITNSFMFDTNNGYSVPIVSSMYFQGTGTGSNWSCAAYKSQLQLYADGGWNTAWEKVVTVRYTKTTD